MIDEKKLIEDLLQNDGITFRMDFKCKTDEETLRSLELFTLNLKEGIVKLINAQPKIQFGVDLAKCEEGWFNAQEHPPKIFESVIMYVPGDSPLPTVHEGYLTGDDIWMSCYGESYTIDEVPLWKPMPTPPKVGADR